METDLGVERSGMTPSSGDLTHLLDLYQWGISSLQRLLVTRLWADMDLTGLSLTSPWPHSTLGWK